MGACASHSSADPSEKGATTGQQRPNNHRTHTNTNRQQNGQQNGTIGNGKGTDADPHSATDNGLRGGVGVGPGDVDLDGLATVLSPPINLLLTSSCGSGAAGSAGGGSAVKGLKPTPSSASANQRLAGGAAGEPFSPTMRAGSFSIDLDCTSPVNRIPTAAASASSSSSRPSTCDIKIPQPPTSYIDPQPGMEHSVAPLHSECINDLTLTDLEGEVLSASDDKTVGIYHFHHGTFEKWNHHSKGVTRAIWCPRLKNLFSGSRDSTVRQWEKGSFREIQSFRGHTLPISALALGSHTNCGGSAPDTLLTGARDYTLRSWSIETGQQVTMTTLPRNVITSIKWIRPVTFDQQIEYQPILAQTTQPTGSVTASSPPQISVAEHHSYDGGINQSGSHNFGQQPHQPPSSSPFRSSPSPPFTTIDNLVSGGDDASCFLQTSEDSEASIRVWDLRTMEVVQTFASSSSSYNEGQQGGKIIKSIQSDPKDSNKFIVVTSANEYSGGEIRLWDRRMASSSSSSSSVSGSCKPLLTILAHSDTIHSFVYLPNSHNSLGQSSNFIATASKDKTLKIWDLSSSSSSSSVSSRCTQVLSFRDSKVGQPRLHAEMTALAIDTRPITLPLSTWMNHSTSSSHHPNIRSILQSETYVLYSASSQGMIATWAWNPNKPQPMIELIAHTKPASGNQTR